MEKPCKLELEESLHEDFRAFPVPFVQIELLILNLGQGTDGKVEDALQAQNFIIGVFHRFPVRR